MEDSTIGLTEASDDSTTGAEDVTGARRLNNGDWVGDGLERRLAGRFPWVAGHLSWGVAICVFIVEFIPNLIAWRYLYPGFLQADHAGTIAYYAQGHLDPWHSVFWALIAKPLLYDSPSYGMYGILPVLVFSGAVAFSITRLARLGIIRMPGIAILAIVFALSPNYLLYNQLYSSDILFAILLVPYTVLLTEVAVTRCHALHRPTFLVGLAMLTWVILELRKNALVVPMLALVVLLIVFHREWRRILVALLVPLVVFVGGNAVFDRVFDVHVQTAGKTTTQELLSVPSVQVGRVYSLGLPIPDDIDALLTEQRPAEYWTNHYLPYNADLEKEGLGLTPDFVTGWLRLGKLYPGVYKDAYWALEKNYVLPASSGLSADFAPHPEFTALVCTRLCKVSYVEQFLADPTPHQAAVINRTLAVPSAEDMGQWGASHPKAWLFLIVFFDTALPLWALVSAFLVLMLRRRKKLLLVSLVPFAAIMVSLLCFTPVVSVRYAMQMYYLLPVVAALALTRWEFPAAARRLDDDGDTADGDTMETGTAKTGQEAAVPAGGPDAAVQEIESR